MAGDLATTYDEVPYADQCFPYTHPDHLATLAAVFGQEPPEVETCRVLEIGCAAGANLIPMALTLPGARFLGIDLSPRQIETGRARINALGLNNITLRVRSLTDIDESFGRFDFILCHGVYSWVPAAVREHILRICSDNLASRGLAYVSYNTFPGWHDRGMMRELLHYHAGRLGATGSAIVFEARRFLGQFAKALPSPEGPYGQVIRAEADRLMGSDDSYIFHEYFEDVNEPCYVSEFLERASARGLRFLAEARLGEPAEQFSAETKAALEEWAGGDPIAREQYVDFLCNGTFRRTVLVHDQGGPHPAPSLSALSAMSLSAQARPVSEAPDCAGTTPETFRAYFDENTLTTGHPLLKTFLSVLHETRPRSWPLEELWREAGRRLGRAMTLPDRPDPGLLEALLRCYRVNMLGLHGNPLRHAVEPGDRPRGSPLARLQAEAGPRVTNLRHRFVVLNGFDQQLLRLLDGTRDRPALLAQLQARVADGSVTIDSESGPLRDPEAIRELIAGAIEPGLERLTRLALLMRTP